jgi:hypothetical protein
MKLAGAFEFEFVSASRVGKEGERGDREENGAAFDNEVSQGLWTFNCPVGLAPVRRKSSMPKPTLSSTNIDIDSVQLNALVQYI